MDTNQVRIRKVQIGDESALAFIQTESWKAAFAHILDSETLIRCTDRNKAVSMYKSLLEEGKGNGYILFVDGKAHCIAWWDAARDPDMSGKAELICIHSLPDKWRKGYGRMMMEQVLSDIRNAGYSEVVLWTFKDNLRAIRFYEAEGFYALDKTKPALSTEEICYQKNL